MRALRVGALAAAIAVAAILVTGGSASSTGDDNLSTLRNKRTVEGLFAQSVSFARR